MFFHYLMGVGIQKFQERGKAGVTKELTQMHSIDVFCQVRNGIADQRGEGKSSRVPHVPKGIIRWVSKGKNVHKWTKA
jgi:hypothetical protein